MAKHREGDESRIGGIEADRPGRSSVAQKIYEQELQKPFVRKEPKRDAPKEGPDKFGLKSDIPKFLSSVQKRLDSSWVYQNFRLPGTQYVVRDLRGQALGYSKEMEKELSYELREGRMEKSKKKSYVNYLGDRSNLQQEAEQRLQEEVNRLLSNFEKLLIERFENDKTIEQKSDDGKPHYREKTREDWKNFFDKLLGRTEWRESELKAIKEFIYRGIISLKEGDGIYSMLIGDILMEDGSFEKFSRMKVYSEIAEKIGDAKPGKSFEEAFIKEALKKESFRYLALAHKHKRRPMLVSRETTKGMFGELKAEDEAARKLGISRKATGNEFDGPIKWGKKGGDADASFVPWNYNKKKKGNKLIWTIVSISIAILLLVIGYLVAGVPGR